MNKSSGGDTISAELFKILKDDAVKVLHPTCQQIWKTQQRPQDWRRCFHSNPKERQYQRIIKLPHNCAYFTCQQGNTQNLSSLASTVYEPRTSRCSSQNQKRQRNQGANRQHPLDHRKSKEIPEKNIYFIDYAKAFDCMDHNKLQKILREMGIPDHLTSLLRNLYAGQATAKIRHGATDWFKIEKAICQGCILSPC